MENAFPLEYVAPRDSIISDQWSEISSSLNFEQPGDVPGSPPPEPQKKPTKETLVEPASKDGSVDLEGEDELLALPDCRHKTLPAPLIGRVSISDIGIQLSEGETSEPQLMMDDVDSDGIDEQGAPPLFSLLGGCLQENEDVSTYSSTSLSDGCNHSTPPVTSVLSKSLPDDDQPAMHRERRVRRSLSPNILVKQMSATLTLNPDRLESEV